MVTFIEPFITHSRKGLQTHPDLSTHTQPLDLIRAWLKPSWKVNKAWEEKPRDFSFQEWLGAHNKCHKRADIPSSVHIVGLKQRGINMNSVYFSLGIVCSCICSFVIGTDSLFNTF